jgi:iron complex outermembrane receptor protein
MSSVRKAVSLAIAISTLGAIAPAHAEPAEETSAVQEVIVTGTRRASTTAADSAVPIDVFTGAELITASGGDMNDLLRNVVPSYNVQRMPINDGSTFVRPSTLRGLPPDETLVLVNSKRRHRSALVQLGGGPLAEGAQGADLAQIPAIALKQVEVLRDGASAQYGSDAIAGVMNFRLKDSAAGWSLGTETGRYVAGDGQNLKVSGNVGLPLTAAGFVNLSAEYIENDLTSRGIQRPDAQALIDSGEPFASNVPRPAQLWGSPELEAVHTFWNIGLDLGGDSSLYAFGNYATSDTGGSFFYRNPTTSGILTTVMPVELDEPGGDTFRFSDMFPGGFTPWFSANIKDFSQVLGVRGKLGSGIGWDLSGSIGRSDIN